MLELRLLGQFDVRFDGGPVEIPTRGAQSLLAYLTLNKGRSHRRERLAGILWPESSSDNARAYLRHALWRIRRSLDETAPTSSAYLSVDDIEIGLKPEAAYWLDIDEMKQPPTESQSPIAELETQVSHYQGELLPGFYGEWAVLEREHLNATFERKMKRLLDLLTAESNWDQVFAQAERWIAFGRVPEAAFQGLMVAQAGMGDAAAVRSTYRRLTEALERELGVEPSPDVVATYQALTEGLQVAIRASSVGVGKEAEQDLPPAPGDPPYLGLSYFDVHDAERFFGRSQLTAKLIGKLNEHPFLGVVVGASGSGKSSLVRAGMLPALRAGQPLEAGIHPPDGSAEWSYHVLTPTSRPLESLASSLTRSARTVVEAAGLMADMAQDRRGLRLYLRRQAAEEHRGRAFILVDQFEELFTQCQDDVERRAFVQNLMEAAGPDGGASVVIVLRADFYAHCSNYPALREALANHQAYIGAMNARELRRAIEGPAQDGNWTLQPGLVDLMLRDVRDEPASLPLLSHALLETWRRRSGRTLTLTGYARAGGVRQAIARTAESVYNQLLDDEQQGIAKGIFLRLTGVGQSMADTRRRAAFRELFDGRGNREKVAEVLTVLGDARLITLHRDSVELAHEALIREWPRLQRWLEEDRESLELHRHLTESALEWERLDRDPGELYRGLRLTAALAWRVANPGRLNALEREFLHRSQAQSEAEISARLQNERRLRWLASGLIVMLVLAVSAAALATRQATRSEAQARLNRQQALLAAAIDNLDIDAERGMLLVLHAIDDPASTDSSILEQAEALLREGMELNRVISTFSGGSLAVIEPEGKWLVTAVDSERLAVIEPGTGASVHSFQPHDGEEVTAMAVSPDGRRLATASFAGDLKIWDTSGWQEVWGKRAHDFPVRSLAFSPDGRQLASGGSDRMLRLWNAFSGEEQLTIAAHLSVVTGLAYMPDSSRLVSAGADRAAYVWDLQTGTAMRLLDGHSSRLTAVAVSADGRLIATAAEDDSVRVWEPDADAPAVVIERAHAGYVTDLAFVSEGETIVTAGADGIAKIWSLSTGGQLSSLQGHSAEIDALDVTRDGTRLVTAASDGSARVWGLSDVGSSAWRRLQGFAAPVQTVDFSQDGKMLAAGGEDGQVLVWDLESGELLQEIASPAGPVADVVFSPAGDLLAIAGQYDSIEFWNPRSGELTFSIGSDNSHFLDLAFTADGDALNALGVPYALYFDVPSGEIIERFANGGNTDGEYSADGRLYAWTDSFGHIGTVLHSGTREYEILPQLADVGVDVYGAEFSPDSRRLVTAGEDGIARVWNADPSLAGPEFSQSDRELLRLTGHVGPVLDAVYSPDGRRIATMGQDGTIRVWDAEVGTELYALPSYGLDIDISPDGRYLAVAGDDGSIRLYLMQLVDLIDQVKARLTRGLTDDECAKYLSVTPCPPFH